MHINCLTDFPYSIRYYLTHPHKFIRQCWMNIKAAWQRITKGYANYDIWDMDHYILEILSRMLRQLATRANGYPGHEPFTTYEEWIKWLQAMATRLEALQTNWTETQNEYEEEYFNALEARRQIIDNQIIYAQDNELKILHDKWLKRAEELNEQQQVETIKVFEELGRYWYLLWD